MTPVSPRTDTGASIADAADTAATRAQVKAQKALDTLSNGVDHAAQEVPDAIARITAQVEDLTRRSLERARQTSAEVRQRVTQAGDRTVERIREDPVKSVLIAAATGAAVAALIGLLNSRRRDY